MNSSELIQKQLDAYNAQDIEAFLETYSEDVEVFNFPDEFIYKGTDKMREVYSNAWKQNPDQKAEVSERIISGNTVVDKENVSGRSNGADINAIVIYKIENSKIKEVYFIKD